MVHETKFLIPLEKVPALLAWVRQNLEPDPHGHGEHADEYLVQSIYFDTPQFHVFRKVGSYSRAKYRVRRYNGCDWLFLERKLKRDGLVRKRRTTVGLDDLPALSGTASARWYDERLRVRQLVPTCFIQYERVARQKATAEGMLRLTIDRGLKFTTDVSLEWPDASMEAMLTDCAILELKYAQLPGLAKRAIELFNLSPTASSKYRTAMRATGLAIPEAELVESEMHELRCA